MNKRCTIEQLYEMDDAMFDPNKAKQSFDKLIKNKKEEQDAEEELSKNLGIDPKDLDKKNETLVVPMQLLETLAEGLARPRFKIGDVFKK